METAALLEDWGKAVRLVGGVPSRREYERVGTYWYDCLAKEKANRRAIAEIRQGM